MFIRYDTERINADIPIRDVIERYTGSKVTSNGVIRCPSPTHEDRHPSAKVYDKTNTCHCFSCNTTFTPITLAKMYNPNLSFPELCRKLIDDFRLDLYSYSNAEEVEKVNGTMDKDKFVDTFPLTRDELRFLGINGYAGLPQWNIPCIETWWADSKDSIEEMMLSYCESKREDLQKASVLYDKAKSIKSKMSEDEIDEAYLYIITKERYTARGEEVFYPDNLKSKICAVECYCKYYFTNFSKEISLTTELENRILNQQKRRLEALKKNKENDYER